MTIVYRAVKGSNLTPDEVDENFRDHEDRIANIEDNPPQAISIDSFSVVGNQLTITMSDASIQGPFTIPTARWRFRGTWEPDTQYAVNDVTTRNGATYLVTYAHTSVSPFDGPGNDWYGLLLADPANMLPAGGTTGQRLVKSSDADFAVEWSSANPAQTLDARIETADLINQVPQYFRAPFDGEVEGLDIAVQEDIGIGGVVTVEVNGIFTFAAVEVEHGAIAGTTYASDPSPRYPFSKGDLLAILPAFPNSPSPTAGALQAAIRVIPD
jgi:hypothetical protein